MRIRDLRMARGWSQSQLAERSGLSVRTIQRIENGAPPGLESLKGLAAAFEMNVPELQAQLSGGAGPMTMIEAVRHCLRHYSDFSGTAGRPEFWWFTLAVALAASLGTAVGPWLATGVGVVAIVPWLAAATRRLRDAGQSPWWLLFLPAPVGGLVIIAVLCAMPSDPGDSAPESTAGDLARV